jgi:hypothetical protein
VLMTSDAAWMWNQEKRFWSLSPIPASRLSLHDRSVAVLNRRPCERFFSFLPHCALYRCRVSFQCRAGIPDHVGTPFHLATNQNMVPVFWSLDRFYPSPGIGEAHARGAVRSLFSQTVMVSHPGIRQKCRVVARGFMLGARP